MKLPRLTTVWPLILGFFTAVYMSAVITGKYEWWVAVLIGGCYVVSWWFQAKTWRLQRRGRGHRKGRANHPGGASGGSRAGIRSRFTRRTREGDRAGVAVPDSAVPVVAYRTWSLAQPGPDPGYWIASCTRGVLWPARAPMIAKCLYSHDFETQDLDGPAEACTCGVYAMKAAQVVIGPVVGPVYLWGKVVEHERGYRAQYAYPARLLLRSTAAFKDSSVADRVARSLAERYGVRCDVVTARTRLTLMDAQ